VALLFTAVHTFIARKRSTVKLLVSSGGGTGRRNELLRRFSVLGNVKLVCPSATPNESVRPSGQLTSEQARLIVCERRHSCHKTTAAVIPGDLLSINVRMVEAENRVLDCGGVLTGTSNSSGDPDEQAHPVVNSPIHPTYQSAQKPASPALIGAGIDCVSARAKSSPRCASPRAAIRVR
jgi:hypothetical protein